MVTKGQGQPRTTNDDEASNKRIVAAIAMITMMMRKNNQWWTQWWCRTTTAQQRWQWWQMNDKDNKRVNGWHKEDNANQSRRMKMTSETRPTIMTTTTTTTTTITTTTTTKQLHKQDNNTPLWNERIPAWRKKPTACRKTTTYKMMPQESNKSSRNRRNRQKTSDFRCPIFLCPGLSGKCGRAILGQSKNRTSVGRTGVFNGLWTRKSHVRCPMSEKKNGQPCLHTLLVEWTDDRVGILFFETGASTAEEV